jgi:hypothetical protein
VVVCWSSVVMLIHPTLSSAPRAPGAIHVFPRRKI